MYTRIYWLPINSSNRGKLGICARPRGHDWLEDEIKAFAHKDILHLVSLLEETEIRQLGLQQEEYWCQQYHIQYYSFPIIDRGVPSSSIEFMKLSQHLAHLIDQGHTVLIHCRMGIGRSALLAASLLRLTGLNSTQAFHCIQQSRGLHVPDTFEQQQWLDCLSYN